MLRSTIYLCAVVLMFPACGPQEAREPAPPTIPGTGNGPKRKRTNSRTRGSSAVAPDRATRAATVIAPGARPKAAAIRIASTRRETWSTSASELHTVGTGAG